jgi:hypothetical protein
VIERVGPRADIDVVAKERVLSSQESNPSRPAWNLIIILTERPGTRFKTSER